MGACDSVKSENLEFYNKVRINGEIKDILTDYLLEESITTPITKNYKFLESNISQGSFSKVLLATDKAGKTYAIKTIKKKKIVKGQLIANEVKIGTHLHHKNILNIMEVYEDKKSISFVMEYCEGGDLFDFITKSPQGKLDDINIIDILVQILRAVNYLHYEAKVCHRDIKPANILITINEENRPLVKLIDFGLAHYIYKDSKMLGKAGTINYMAPEILEDKYYDEKVDIWSTGMVLYNMISGCEPFAPGDFEFKKMQILNSPINFGVIKNDDFRELCQEMLERDPDKRIDAKTALEKAFMIKRKIFNEY